MLLKVSFYVVFLIFYEYNWWNDCFTDKHPQPDPTIKICDLFTLKVAQNLNAEHFILQTPDIISPDHTLSCHLGPIKSLGWGRVSIFGPRSIGVNV